LRDFRDARQPIRRARPRGAQADRHRVGFGSARPGDTARGAHPTATHSALMLSARTILPQRARSLAHSSPNACGDLLAAMVTPSSPARLTNVGSVDALTNRSNSLVMMAVGVPA